MSTRFWWGLLQTTLYIVLFILAVKLSILLHSYYTDHHLPRMDPYPIKIEGSNAYLLILSITLSIAHLVFHVCLTASEWRVLFKPTQRTILGALIVFLLTPITNLSFIPIPVILGMATSTKTDESSTGFGLAMLLAPGLAYAAVCLSRRSSLRPDGAIDIILLYLWSAYAIGVLYFGVYYI